MFYLIGKSNKIDSLIYEIISKQFIEDCDSKNRHKIIGLLIRKVWTWP